MNNSSDKTVSNYPLSPFVPPSTDLVITKSSLTKATWFRGKKTTKHRSWKDLEKSVSSKALFYSWESEPIGICNLSKIIQGNNEKDMTGL